MPTLKRSTLSGADFALRLDRLRKEHQCTSYAPEPTASIPLDDHERPLNCNPRHAWPTDVDMIGTDVDPSDWPAWTDQVAFGVSAEIGGES